MALVFSILRYDPSKNDGPVFQDFIYEPRGKESVLEALMDIRNEQDASLSFRYSCREAVCGSCAMVINGEFELACRTMIESLETTRIVVEPLPGFEIQKDLVVDMNPFWESLQKVDPYVAAESPFPEKGFRISEKQMEKIEQYTNCVLCGCCFSACPVTSRDNGYLGPIALAKLYRFIRDPRDNRPFSQWAKVNMETGLWGCDTVFKCNEVCPKEVRPADGIEALRRTFIFEKLKRLIGLKK